VFEWLQARGVDVGEYQASITESFDPSSAMAVVQDAIAGIGAVLSNGLMVLLTVVFILLEASGMPAKLQRVLSDPETSIGGFRAFIDSVKRYLLIKTLVSAITGLIVGVWLAILGVDFPVLWGMVAFAFNYIPTIGSVIAAVPVLLLAVVQLGPGAVISVCICYLATNLLMGNIVEPRIMGKGLGLSALVVFVSLVFWGWLLGITGMLLSVPLTMIVKIACEQSEKTKPVAVLLGPTPPEPATESG
jgi:predicted PurR-regulated permease PerM